MKWMGQDLLNNKITDQMEQMLERYPKEPIEEQHMNLRENSVYFMNGQQMDQEKPKVVIIADPPITITPAIGSKGAIEEEGLMEIVETEIEKQPKIKRQAKEKRIAQDENKAELEKVKSGNFQQPTGNLNDKIKYQRGLGKCGQVLNKALKEGKYVVDYQYRRVSLSNPCVQQYLAHMVPTLDDEVALMATELINRIYGEAGLEIETIRYCGPNIFVNYNSTSCRQIYRKSYGIFLKRN
uniref:Uncharacterized protein n=1 Tax=Romanomermis culicivorax TaxID=13658 RepID=A0A915K5G7_ROMCU